MPSGLDPLGNHIALANPELRNGTWPLHSSRQLAYLACKCLHRVVLCLQCQALGVGPARWSAGSRPGSSPPDQGRGPRPVDLMQCLQRLMGLAMFRLAQQRRKICSRLHVECSDGNQFQKQISYNQHAGLPWTTMRRCSTWRYRMTQLCASPGATSRAQVSLFAFRLVRV